MVSNFVEISFLAKNGHASLTKDAATRLIYLMAVLAVVRNEKKWFNFFHQKKKIEKESNCICNYGACLCKLIVRDLFPKTDA